MTPHSSRPTAESGRALRTLALVAVVVGLLALTTAACVLTYSSVHDFALRAGISPSLARIYPYIGDAMLVMAGCSVLALRGAGLLSKVYGWLCFIVLLGALAASSVIHDAGLIVPLRTAEITAAVFPWALVLVAFGLLLALLRHAKRKRQAQRASSATDDTLASSRAALEAGEPAAYEAADEYDAEAYDAAGDYEAAGGFEGAGGYEAGEPYEYVSLQPTSQYPATSPESVRPSDEAGGYDAAGGAGEADTAERGAVNPTVPLPRANVEPEDAQAQPPRSVIRPTEMQLRARAPRQLGPAEGAAADQAAGAGSAEFDPAGGGPAGAHPAGAGPAAGDPAAGDPAGAGPAGADPAGADPERADPTPPAGAPVTEPPTSGFTGDTIPRGELSPAPTPKQPSTKPPRLDRPRSSPTPPS